jgi:hypothetical protein
MMNSNRIRMQFYVQLLLVVTYLGLNLEDTDGMLDQSVSLLGWYIGG